MRRCGVAPCGVVRTSRFDQRRVDLRAIIRLEHASDRPAERKEEVTLESLREQLHVYASNRGGMVGPIKLIDSGDEIDCSRMGSGGYSIPSIVEEEVIRFKKCTAKFILHVEKDTVWRRFNEDKFWRKHVRFELCLLNFH